MEGNRSLVNFSKEATREEPLPISRITDSSVQFMQLLDVMEHQENNNLSNSLHDDGSVERNKQSIFLWDGVNAFPSTFNFKKTIQCLEMSDNTQNGTKSKSQQISSLMAPEAVFSLNQAATDTNNENGKYLFGWPFLPEYKMQLTKCEKCSREFCSAINYKRHIRGHRKSQNMEKDSLTNRELLESYWDKLSLKEAIGIVGFSKASIGDITGASLIMALASAFKKPGFALMPHMYVKAGSALLDFIGEKSSTSLPSSQELFSILDDASEKTFLSGGDALTLQKYIFGGNAGKIALELTNLVASVSFMLEQELIKGWLIYKETEVQRCQQLLMEEEEAAQRRQADLLERKRMKKQRQKEKKVKDSTNMIKANIMASSFDGVEVISGVGRTNPRLQLDDCLNSSEASLNQCSKFLEKTRSVESETDLSMKSYSRTEDTVQNLDQHQQLVNSRQVPEATDCSPEQNSAETYPVQLANGFTNYISIMKLNYGEPLIRRHSTYKVEHNNPNTHEVVIGSILIKLEDDHEQNEQLKSSRERLVDGDSTLITKNILSSNFSESLSHNYDCATSCEKMESAASKLPDDADFTNQTENRSCLAFGTVDYNDIEKPVDSSYILGTASSTNKSNKADNVFLTQRWKEAIEAHHHALTCVADHGASIQPENGVGCV